ncbi:MAG: T9SS type A sorting domain-containing protein [Bacteroidetes bacterium]|nr:MAG: T9SS type A sorting domain-containing protein [Bacteroidota bacterium]
MKIKLIIIYLFLTLIPSVFLLFNIKNNSNDIYYNVDTRLMHKLSKAELALIRTEYEFMKIRNPYTNSIPKNARQRELEFSSQIPTRESFQMKNKDVTLSQQWTSMGPKNVSGRMLAIEFDINNENVILAGSASGGIWKSIDRGNSWIRTSSPDDLLGVTCIAQDLRMGKNNIWYYGSGELLSTTDRRITTSVRTIGLGNGIYKSTDNGSSWFPLKKTQCLLNGKLSEVFQGIWNIKIDKKSANEDILYAACYGAIMRSSNGGNSWDMVLGDTNKKSFSTDIAMTDNGIYYASLSTFTSSGKKPEYTGIWKSTNGINWINITPDDFPSETRVIKLALAPSNHNVLYVITEVPQHSKSIQAFYPSYHGLYKFTVNPSTGQGTWETKTANLPGEGTDNYDDNSLNTLGGYALVLKVKPDDENVLFLGGTSMFRTTNGFNDSTTNKNIGGYPYDWTVNELHPDMHGIAFLPSNPNTMFVANDGGIQVTINCMDDFVKWNYSSDGLITSQFYTIAIDHKGNHDGLYFGGLQDNASQVLNSDDPDQSWKTIYGGDGMSTAIADNGDFLIGSIYYGYIFTSDIEGNKIIMQRPNIIEWSQSSFYTTFTLDINNSKTLYLSAKNQVWRKNDISVSAFDSSRVEEGWEEISADKIGYSSYVSALKADSSRLYIGTSNGKVFRLDDPRSNKNSPYEITCKDFPFFGFISCIETEPDNSDNVFVVFSNYAVLSIFYSSDGGMNWTKQGGNLEGNYETGTLGPSVRYVKILKFHGKTVYFAGTSTGLYSTTELVGSNTVWVKEASNTIGNSIIDYIDTRNTDGLVVIATQGSGVFNAYYSISGNDSRNTENYFSLEQNSPNPAEDYTDIKFSTEKPGNSIINLYDMHGNFIKNITNTYYHTGNHSIRLNVSNLKSGVYFYTMESGNKKQTKKMIILR